MHDSSSVCRSWKLTWRVVNWFGKSSLTCRIHLRCRSCWNSRRLCDNCVCLPKASFAKRWKCWNQKISDWLCLADCVILRGGVGMETKVRFGTRKKIGGKGDKENEHAKKMIIWFSFFSTYLWMLSCVWIWNTTREIKLFRCEHFDLFLLQCWFDLVSGIWKGRNFAGCVWRSAVCSVSSNAAKSLFSISRAFESDSQRARHSIHSAQTFCSTWRGLFFVFVLWIDVVIFLEWQVKSEDAKFVEPKFEEVMQDPIQLQNLLGFAGRM